VLGAQCSVLLLVGVICVSRASFEREFGFNLPGVLVHVINVQVLVRVVPPNHIKLMVVAEHVVAEGTYFGELRVSFHEVLLDVELEAFTSANSLIETSKNKDCF
jgi:hypothetical protein